MQKNSSLALRAPNRNVVIEGRNIFLKPLSNNEINERYLSWLNDPKVNQFLDQVRHKRQSLEDVVDYVNATRLKIGCEVFAVLTIAAKIHIGNIGITLYNQEQGYAGYGIMIGDPKARMLGFGGEATALIVEYLFRDPFVRRIQENTYSENEKSWKTLELLGFKREGILREHVVLSSGKICDLYIHGILKEEWCEHRKKMEHILKYVRIKKYETI